MTKLKATPKAAAIKVGMTAGFVRANGAASEQTNTTPNPT
jgi:hypothetical protein